MDQADAVKMILIMAEADGGCTFCAKALFEEAVYHWPDVDWLAVAKALPSDKWHKSRTAELLEAAIKESSER